MRNDRRGLVAMAAKILGAHKVFATETEHALPLLTQTILDNKFSDITAVALEWTENESLLTANLPMFSYIFCSDLVWITDLVPPLIKTLSKIAQPQFTVVYFAHQSRSIICDDLLVRCLIEEGFLVETVDDSLLHPDYKKDSVVIYKLHLFK